MSSGYYTIDNLETFYSQLVDDVISIDKDGNIKTKTGTTSPVKNLAHLAFDRMWEGYADENEEATEAQCEKHAQLNFKTEMMYYLTENIECDCPYEELNMLLTGHSNSYVDGQILKDNIFSWIGYLPIEWVHEKILQK